MQKFRLPCDTDTQVVRKIFKKVGLALLEHPELREKFIQPLKSQGLFRIEEGALILRTKCMCIPREQFGIRKAVFQDEKMRFMRPASNWRSVGFKSSGMIMNNPRLTANCKSAH